MFMSGSGLTVVAFALVAMLPMGCEESTPSDQVPQVIGTLTLPASVPGKPYFVRVVTMPGPAFVAQASGTTSDTTTISYTMGNGVSIPAGTYYVLGFVDVDESGGDASTSGDFRGWYGHNGDGNPPASPNVTISSNVTTRFDIDLVIAP
jgi:hypothetical protein